MRSTGKAFRMMIAVLSLLIFSMTTAFASGENVDWNKNVIRATGGGVAPAGARNAAQAKMMARRAAIVDAYRQLAESAGGVNIDAETTVDMASVSSDVIKTKVQAVVRGARIVSEKATADGGYEVTVEVPLYGVSSLASAVLGRPDSVQSFPAPDASVAPSSVNVEVHVDPGAPAVNRPVTTTGSAASSSGSSAAETPAGRAIGGFTGLIVDCRGLGLKPVMSPVIENEIGQPIYGYKNLDYDKVVENGMAGYAYDWSTAGRAGSHPLVVRAMALDKQHSNPILSMADANRVLIENGAAHFLDETKVVFLR